MTEESEGSEATLRAIIQRLKREIRHKDEALREKNLALDELHYVWCDGNCAGGVHRYSDEYFTEAVVLQAEYQAKRLRSKYTTMRWVVENWNNRPDTQSEWHHKHVECLREKLRLREK